MERRSFLKLTAATGVAATWLVSARAQSEGNAAGGSDQKLETAPTRILNVDGISHGYRRFGRHKGNPTLVCITHYRGSMDSWDPAVLNSLAEQREIVVFDNSGVGRSSGVPQNTVAATAQQANAFVRQLGLSKIDLYGFSLGGMIAQQITLDNPDLVRRLILNGTAPRGGEGFSPPAPEVAAFLARPPSTGEDLRQRMFFTQSDASQAAARKFVERTKLRKTDREPISGVEVVRAQSAAIDSWGNADKGNFEYLKQIKQPVLVVNGDNDIIVPTVNSYTLQKNLPNAQLAIYPDAGHASQFQYPNLFCRHVDLFLGSATEWPT
jgi:pimeloyl-ACP methyl ester carboxylesterase